MIDIDGVPSFYLKKSNKAIILIEEIWGLNNNIKDIAQRLANEGYTVLAPELLAETGILGKIQPEIFKEMADPAKRDEAQKKMREALAPMHAPGFAQNTVTKLQKCYDHLHKQNMSIAVMGFCFGGTYSFALAAHQPGIKAAISFYGQPPSEEDVKNIRCPILAFYGERDEHLINTLPQLEENMKKYHKNFQFKIYKNCGHAFFNDTNKMMYNKEAAEDSWELVKEFLQIHL